MQLNIPKPISDTAEEWRRYLHNINEDPDNKKRKSDSYRVHQHYDGKYRDELRNLIYSRMDASVNKNAHPIWCNNLMRYAVNTLSITYDGQINRQIDTQSEEQTKLLEKIGEELTHANETASRWIFLDKQLLTQPKQNIEGKIVFKVYPQYEYDVIHTDGILEAVILSDYGKSFSDTNFWVYTTDKFYVFLGSKLVSEETNIAKVIPFVMILSENLGFNDYLDPAAEFADLELELDSMSSNIQYTHRLQSHAIPVITLTPDSVIGDTSEDETETRTGRNLGTTNSGTAMALTIDEFNREEKFSYVNPGLNFADLVSPLKEYTMSFLRSMGVPDGIVNIDIVSGAVKPATTRFLGEQKIKDLNGKYEDIFKQTEKKQVELLNILLGLGLDAESFSVSFTPKQRTLEYLEPTEMQILLSIGVLDRYDVRGIISGITREEAIEILNNSEVIENERTNRDANANGDRDREDDGSNRNQ